MGRRNVSSIVLLVALFASFSAWAQPIPGTTVTAKQGGTWNITNVSGTISLPTGAATVAKQPALGTAGTASADVITVQGIVGMTAIKVDGSGVTGPISIALGQAVDGSIVTLGLKADAKSTSTDTTPVTLMQVVKEISAMEQAPASRAVTNAGVFAVQATVASGGVASGGVASGAFASGALASGSVVDGAVVTLGAKADAKSTATDTTSVTAMQVLKEISFMLQTPAALPANQSTNIAQMNGVTVTMGNGSSGTGVQRVTLSDDSTGQVKLATGANTIGALTANQSTNIAQMNGVTVTMGNGSSGTGVQRVTLSDDSTGQVKLATGANTIGALTANQSVNLAQVNGSTIITSGVTGAQAMGGDTAAAATDAGFPLKVGGVGRITLPTLVTDGQRVNFIGEPYGRQIHVLGTVRNLRKFQPTTITSSTAEVTIIDAGAAGIFNDLISLHVSNSAATATLLTIRDKTGGGGNFSAIYYIPALFDGIIFNQSGESQPQNAAGNNWSAQCGSSTASIYINATYEQNK